MNSIRSRLRNLRKGDVVFPLAMLLALSLIYRRLLAGWVIAAGDLHTYFFPYWTAAARAFQAGQLPLWNPHLFAGAPLLANSQVGVFYPLNWPLWLLSGPTLPGMARTLHWSVVLHLMLAALATYTLARRWRMSAGAAALAGLLYAGSGYLGVQTEHLNQLQGLAWLPFVLLPGDRRSDRRGWPAPLSVGAMAMILLAGHTQTAFIAAIAATVWRLGMGLGRGEGLWKWSYIAYSLRALLPFGLAGGIALAQLLPTLELARFSARGGGMPWREAVSFSVAPWQLPRALLPPYLIAPLLPEGVAYLGLVGMALAGWGAWRALRSDERRDWMLLLVAALGGFLALGGFNPLYLAAVRLGAPGLVHFRAPARFLVLYVLAGSLLAGRGLMALGNIRRRAWLWRGIAAVLIAAELLFAAELMPLGDVTAPRAYTDLRPATAHLVAATRQAEAESAAPAGRYLSMSQVLFDPGDLTEIRQIYGAALMREWGAWGDASEDGEDGNENARDALWAYVVAAKQREVLAPNLSLAYEIPAVDGYDGGVLPLRHYSAFSRLLLSSPAELTSEGTWDGRLRENLTAVPDGRWLSLLGVRFLLTDKTGDAWADDIFYDRQFRPSLAPGERLELAWLPADFEANAVGVIYEGAGTVVVHLADGSTVTRDLPAILGRGSDDPLGANDSLGAAQHAQRVRWPDPAAVSSLEAGAGGDGLRLSGLSLVDERTGAFYPLTLSDRFRLAHSGDVKIYENLAPQPRAFFVPEARCFEDDKALLRALHDPAFDPTREVALSGECETTPVSSETAAADVRVRAYDAVRVEIDVTTAHAGHVVFTDAWYPGWQAEIAPLAGAGEAREATILRADALFRAVAVTPGEWRITFTYRPAWLPWGLGLSAISLLAWGAYALKIHATAVSHAKAQIRQDF